MLWVRTTYSQRRLGEKNIKNSHLLEVMKALVVIGAHSETAVRVRDRVGFKWFSNVSHSFNYGYLFSVLIIGFTVFQVIVWCIVSLACHMSSKFHEHPRLPSSSVLMGLGLSKNMWYLKLYLSLLRISSIWHRSPFVVFSVLFVNYIRFSPIPDDIDGASASSLL